MKRLRLVEEIFTADGSYLDALADVPATGHRAVNEHMGAMQPSAAGAYYEPAAWTATDIHHDRIRMRWRLCDANGDVQLIGVDVGALDPDGRIREIAGFFRDPEPSPEDGDICQGRDPAAWAHLPNIVRRYGDAWMATENRQRAAILDEIWADDGYYVDPFVEGPVIGRGALNRHMGFGMAAGHYVEVTVWTAGNLHHDRVWIPWRHCCPTGAVLLEGDDIGEVDSNRQLSRVTSFWNNEVALPADVACD